MCVCVLHNVTGVFCLKQAFVFTIYISWNEMNYTVDSTSGKLENDILFNLRQSGAGIQGRNLGTCCLMCTVLSCCL